MPYEFKPLNLAQLYAGADQAVASAMQMNLMALQASRMKQEFDEEDALRSLAKRHTVTDETTGAVGMDLKSFTKGAYSINPIKAIGFEKAASEAEKSALERAKLVGELDKQRRDSAFKRIELMGNASTAPFLEYQKLIDGGMADEDARAKVQPTFDAARQQLISSGLFTEEQLRAAPIMQTRAFDPTIAKSAMDQVVGAGKQLEEYLKGREPKSDLGKLQADFKSGKLDKPTFDAKIKKELGPKWEYDDARGVLVNTDSGETKQVGGGNLPPRAGDTEALRKEFNNREEVKNYNAAVPVLRSIVNAPNTTAGDLDFIYGVGKILDPGSVVREGEMALVIKSGSPLERIIGKGTWVAGKGKLTPTMRAELLETLNSRVKELRTAAEGARKPFEAQATRQGIKLEETLTLPELPQLRKAGAKPAANAPAAGTIEDGYRFKGGDPSKPENWEKVS